MLPRTQKPGLLTPPTVLFLTRGREAAWASPELFSHRISHCLQHGAPPLPLPASAQVSSGLLHTSPPGHRALRPSKIPLGPTSSMWLARCLHRSQPDAEVDKTTGFPGSCSCFEKPAAQKCSGIKQLTLREDISRQTSIFS